MFVSPSIDSHPEHVSKNKEYIEWIKLNMGMYTGFRSLFEGKDFVDESLIPLLFGQFKSGLRQQAIRKLIYRDLFKGDYDDLMRILKNYKNPKPSESFKDSACVIENSVCTNVSINVYGMKSSPASPENIPAPDEFTTSTPQPAKNSASAIRRTTSAQN